MRSPFANVDTLPEHFLGVERLTLLVLMPQSDNAEHGEVGRHIEESLYIVFRRLVVARETATNLNPAASKPKSFGLELNVGSSNCGIFHPSVGNGRVGAHHDSEAALANGSSTRVFSVAYMLEFLFVFNSDEMPRAAILRGRSHKGSLEYELHIVGGNFFVGVFANAATTHQ